MTSETLDEQFVNSTHWKCSWDFTYRSRMGLVVKLIAHSHDLFTSSLDPNLISCEVMSLQKYKTNLVVGAKKFVTGLKIPFIQMYEDLLAASWLRVGRVVGVKIRDLRFPCVMSNLVATSSVAPHSTAKESLLCSLTELWWHSSTHRIRHCRNTPVQFAASMNGWSNCWTGWTRPTYQKVYRDFYPWDLHSNPRRITIFSTLEKQMKSAPNLNWNWPNQINWPKRPKMGRYWALAIIRKVDSKKCPKNRPKSH